jgi:hypothetical protein
MFRGSVQRQTVGVITLLLAGAILIATFQRLRKLI